MKSLVLAPFSDDALLALQQLMPVIYQNWQESRRLQSPEELTSKINQEQIGALIIEADFVFDEVFQESPCLKFLGVCRSVLNHVDLDAATRHGVVVVYTPGRNATAVAELVVGLMISLARRIPQSDRYVKEGLWIDPVEPYIDMRGYELRGRTLGIIGLGVIGRAVARLGRALGMLVVGYDPLVGPTERHKREMRLIGLEQLLQQADFISVHTSTTPATEGLLNGQRLRMMKRGSYLINTASHSVIEEAALVELLRTEHIAGAALDVHISHPIPPCNPLLKLENVILTPHIGGATQETVRRHSWMIVEDFRRFLLGKRPMHMANPEVWGHRG